MSFPELRPRARFCHRPREAAGFGCSAALVADVRSERSSYVPQLPYWPGSRLYKVVAGGRVGRGSKLKSAASCCCSDQRLRLQRPGPEPGRRLGLRLGRSEKRPKSTHGRPGDRYPRHWQGPGLAQAARAEKRLCQWVRGSLETTSAACESAVTVTRWLDKARADSVDSDPSLTSGSTLAGGPQTRPG